MQPAGSARCSRTLVSGLVLSSPWLRKFRLSPDVFVLSARGLAEGQLVADLQRIAAAGPDPPPQAVVARLTAADGARTRSATRRSRRSMRSTIAWSSTWIRPWGGGVRAGTGNRLGSGNGGAGPCGRSRDTLAKDSTSAKRAMVIAYALRLGLIAFFAVVIAPNRPSAEPSARRRVRVHGTHREHRSTDRTAQPPCIPRRASRELQRVSRGPTPLSLVMLDLDGLKVVNDGLGHQAGDERLRELSPPPYVATHRAGDSAYRVAETSSPWCSPRRAHGRTSSSCSGSPPSWSPALMARLSQPASPRRSTCAIRTS